MNFRKLGEFNIYTNTVVDAAWELAETALYSARNFNRPYIEDVKALREKIINQYPELASDVRDEELQINIGDVFAFITEEARKLTDERSL